MSITVAVPTNSLFAPLIANADHVAKANAFRIIRGTEQECSLWLDRNIANVALLTPLGYARSALATDLRIVPSGALALDALTYSGSIYLREEAKGAILSRCACPRAQDFLMQMGLAVLSEKFDLELTVEKVDGSIEKLLSHYDVVLDYGFDGSQRIVLDISDEWSDYFGIMLPLALWVCRVDEIPENIVEVLAAFRDPAIPLTQEVSEQLHDGVTAHRTGIVSMIWNDDVEESLQHTIELLYYWQYVPQIAATKVWQRDTVEWL
ncbi:MAG: hypothetical protein RML40_00095 [Bacteroidota bacterium]|nr:hypothetical protein [Candidatus Kapabacteria bacterium]MDW8218906.1 hypothetical protein [Bacteroidota bacterium]